MEFPPPLPFPPLQPSLPLPTPAEREKNKMYHRIESGKCLFPFPLKNIPAPPRSGIFIVHLLSPPPKERFNTKLFIPFFFLFFSPPPRIKGLQIFAGGCPNQMNKKYIPFGLVTGACYVEIFVR